MDNTNQTIRSNRLLLNCLNTMKKDEGEIPCHLINLQIFKCKGNIYIRIVHIKCWNKGINQMTAVVKHHKEREKMGKWLPIVLSYIVRGNQVIRSNGHYSLTNTRLNEKR